MSDYTKLRELIDAAPKWPDVKAAAEDGGTWYTCPLCSGEGSVDAECVEERRSDIWAGGFQFYGCGDEHVALDALVREMIATVPSLLTERDAALAEAAAHKAEVERLRGLLRHFVSNRRVKHCGNMVIGYEVYWDADKTIHKELTDAAYPPAATPTAKEERREQ